MVETVVSWCCVFWRDHVFLTEKFWSDQVLFFQIEGTVFPIYASCFKGITKVPRVQFRWIEELGF